MATPDNGDTPTPIPVPETSPCELASNLVVGEEYNVESDDGQQTGVFRITSIDTENCQACFLIVSGDWTEFTAEDYDVKIFYGPNTLTDYCVLNPSPEPVWVPFGSDSVWKDFSSYFDGDVCWVINLSSTSTVNIESYNDIEEFGNPGIHAIRLTFSTTDVIPSVGITLRQGFSNDLAPQQIIEDTTNPQIVTFTFDPETELFNFDPNNSFENFIQLRLDTFGPYTTLQLCNIEILVDAELEQTFLDYNTRTPPPL